MSSKLFDDIHAARGHKERALIKAHAHDAALKNRRAKKGTITLERDGVTIIVDSHGLVLDPVGVVVGFDVMIRAFREGAELQIDPHRRFINPPIQVPSLNNKGFIEDIDLAFETMLFESIVDAPAPQFWKTEGSTVDTFYGIANDGYIESANATYSTARNGGGTLTAYDSATYGLKIGQNTGYSVWQGFIGFDTSAIPDTDVVSTFDLQLYWTAISSGNKSWAPFCIVRTWSSSGLTTGDYAGSPVPSSPILCYPVNMSNFNAGNIPTYISLTNNYLDTTQINLTGKTELVLISTNTVYNTPPTNDESITFDGAGYSGTSHDPKLIVTHAAPTAPTVNTPTKTSITLTTATLGGNVSSDGGAAITERGVCWSTSANPTTSNSKNTSAGTTGVFTVSATGLTSGTTYHYRAYAINSIGTSYSTDDTFTTLSSMLQGRISRVAVHRAVGW